MTILTREDQERIEQERFDRTYGKMTPKLRKIWDETNRHNRFLEAVEYQRVLEEQRKEREYVRNIPW